MFNLQKPVLVKCMKFVTGCVKIVKFLEFVKFKKIVYHNTYYILYRRYPLES